MLQVRIEAGGRLVAIVAIRPNTIGVRPSRWELFPILLQKLLLNGRRERVYGVARLRLARPAGEFQRCEARGHGPFAADKFHSEGFLRRRALEVDLQGHSEGRMLFSLGVIEQRQHYVRNIASVLPEAQTAGGKHPGWPDRAGCVMQSGE